MGTCGFDVGYFAYFFGIPGGYSFEHDFMSQPPTNAIIALEKLFMADTICGEIRSTLKENCGNSMIDDVINNTIENMKAGNCDKN